MTNETMLRAEERAELIHRLAELTGAAASEFAALTLAELREQDNLLHYDVVISDC